MPDDSYRIIGISFPGEVLRSTSHNADTGILAACQIAGGWEQNVGSYEAAVAVSGYIPQTSPDGNEELL